MDVPSKIQVFVVFIGFMLANFVLYAICRTLKRPKNTCPGNVKIMRSGAGSGSNLIDNLRGVGILGHRKWGCPFASNSVWIGVRWLGVREIAIGFDLHSIVTICVK